MIEYSTAGFTEFMTSETLLSKFHTNLSRWQVERIASGQDKYWCKYIDNEYYGDGSVASMIEWLSSLDSSLDFTVSATYEGDIVATHTIEVPYTEEQVEAAKAWLRDHPKVDGQVVTFRPPVPFKEFRESYED